MALSDKQLREVFHLIFLERLLKTAEPRFFILKGGVNLRFVFNSSRYSENIDLYVPTVSVGTRKKNVYKIKEFNSLRFMRPPRRHP